MTLNGNVIEELIPEGEQIEGISQSTYDVMREGMYRVVHAAGTAAGAFTGLQIDIAGKSVPYRRIFFTCETTQPSFHMVRTTIQRFP